MSFLESISLQLPLKSSRLKGKLKKHFSQKQRAKLRAIYQKAMLPLYLGSTYYCPCCHTGLRKLLPFYGTENTRCPNCNSIARYRLYWLYLKRKTDLFHSRRKILHFAPEAALSRNLKKMPNLNYITADLLASFIDNMCVKPDVIMDVCNIKFPSNTFDVVLCNHLLEHVPDDRKAMCEVYRVLKPDGWALMQVPINEELSETHEDPAIVSKSDRAHHYGNPDHLRLYGKDYKSKLESVGFKVKTKNYIYELDPQEIDKYQLIDKETLYIAKKVSEEPIKE